MDLSMLGKGRSKKGHVHKKDFKPIVDNAGAMDALKVPEKSNPLMP